MDIDELKNEVENIASTQKALKKEANKVRHRLELGRDRWGFKQKEKPKKIYKRDYWGRRID
ncbi:hypothetical protein [Fuchsiella alkaliacetigena]|uniref:hypothetical protein n=1 Tax=Fuchsiella alkaliacetigena TaxID=957042 RepID=UPI00200B5D6A|nr:hypothetical protein [Fuchsiella alkaliacetigena]MCK8823684.1 hypothetical protein [Fuchsiella alkaliacetigena]